MFMNAKPRIVSNGIETFVPAQIVDLVHQRLFKMTNSNVNAWSVFGPVATSANATWEQQIDDFGGNENYPVRLDRILRYSRKLTIDRCITYMADTIQSHPLFLGLQHFLHQGSTVVRLQTKASSKLGKDLLHRNNHSSSIKNHREI